MGIHMKERLRQHFRFTVQSLLLAFPLQFLMNPLFGWSVFNTAWVTSAGLILGYQLFTQARRRYSASHQKPEQQPNNNPPIPNLPESEPLSRKDQLLAELLTRNSLLGTVANAIEDKVFHEACIFIESAFLILGEQAFNDRYQASEVDDILPEIVYLLPAANDSDAAAIARRLELDEEAIELLNDDTKAYEDGKTTQGDTLNRHVNGFHARFYWSALHPEIINLQEKLREYAKNQWQTIKAQHADILIQAIQLFDWIYKVNSDFNQFIEDANRYHLEHTLNNHLEEQPEERPVTLAPAEETPLPPPAPAVANTYEERRQRMLEAALRRQESASTTTNSAPKIQL